MIPRGTTVVTHFRFDSLNLTTAQVEGMFQVGNQGLNAAFYDGYMSPIPANWQSALGAPYLTGNAAISHHRPDIFGTGGLRLRSEHLQHLDSHPHDALRLLPAHQSAWGSGVPQACCTMGTRQSKVSSSCPAAVPFCSSARSGTNTLRGTATRQFQRSISDRQRHPLPQRRLRISGVGLRCQRFSRGQERADAALATPTLCHVELDFPQFDGAKYIGGVTFDPATSRLYVTELGGDTQAAYSYLPVVQVYQLTLSSGGSPAVQTSDVTLQAATGSPSVASGNTSNTTIAVSAIAAPAVSSADSSPQTSLAGPVSQATAGSTTSRKRPPATLPPPSGTVSLLQLGSRGSIWTRSAKSKGLTNFKSLGSLIEP